MMKGNTYKAKNRTYKTGGSLFSWVQRILNLDRLMEEGIPLRYIPQILFLTGVTIFYIGNNHYAEKTTRKIEQLETEVDELRADYTSLKADCMFSSKQSEVAKRVKSMGLEENDSPPKKIKVKEEE